MSEITFACTLFDGKDNVPAASRGYYTPAWADKLWRGIRRWYSRPFRLVVLSSHTTSGQYDEDVEVVDFLEDKHNWLNMMEMYRPGLADGRLFTLGLDAVITGSLDDLVGYDGEFAADNCPWSPGLWCNGVTLTSRARRETIWATWLEHGHVTMNLCGKPSELAWMRKFIEPPTLVRTLFPGQVVSYPVHVQNKMREPGEARVVSFHGRAKPHNCSTDWVAAQWI